MSKKPNIEHRQKSFIRKLLRFKTAYISKDKKFRFSSSEILVNLGKEEISQLASLGIIEFTPNKISINSLSKKWLLRKMANNGASKEEQFSEQHRNIKFNNDGVKINLNESPISRLTIVRAGKKPYLEPHHVEAARRFSNLMERSHLRSRITMSYNDAQLASTKSSSNVKLDISDMAIDARKTMESLLADIPKDWASIIIDVCGFEKGLQTVESERGWPRRSAKLVLRIGLEQLAFNLGLCQKAIGSNRNNINSWIEQGSLPTKYY